MQAITVFVKFIQMLLNQNFPIETSALFQCIDLKTSFGVHSSPWVHLSKVIRKMT